jgi:hypothetical protein
MKLSKTMFHDILFAAKRALYFMNFPHKFDMIFKFLP